MAIIVGKCVHSVTRSFSLVFYNYILLYQKFLVGILMYEIHMPIIMLAKLAMENGNMSKDDAKKEFRRAILNLKMSLEMLKYEPDGSFEKNIYHGAKGSVAPLESFISTL